MPASPVISLSPHTFNSYSNSNLAEIAARVVEEFRTENGYDSEFFEEDATFCALESDEKLVTGDSGKWKSKDGDGDEEESEFEFVPGGTEFSPISADEIFYNGQIRPTFNRNLLLDDVNFDQASSASRRRSNSGDEKAKHLPAKIRLPLRKLFDEDRESQSSCSSQEGDEIDGIPPGTYCVWQPNATVEKSPSTSMCRKSNSTGWSKRWKFRDLVHRSNSEGKETFLFLSPSLKKGTQKLEKPAAAEALNATGKLGTPPHSMKDDGDRRRSFLPYRQDLVGFFAHGNGLSRSSHPF